MNYCFLAGERFCIVASMSTHSVSELARAGLKFSEKSRVLSPAWSEVVGINLFKSSTPPFIPRRLIKPPPADRRLSSFTVDEFASEFLLCRALGVRARRVCDEYKSRHGREDELRQRWWNKRASSTILSFPAAGERGGGRGGGRWYLNNGDYLPPTFFPSFLSPPSPPVLVLLFIPSLLVAFINGKKSARHASMVLLVVEKARILSPPIRARYSVPSSRRVGKRRDSLTTAEIRADKAGVIK